MPSLHPCIEAIEVKFWADLAKSLQYKVVTMYCPSLVSFGENQILCAPTVKLMYIVLFLSKYKKYAKLQIKTQTLKKDRKKWFDFDKW